MLFKWEIQTHQAFMILLLVSAAIIAIVINQSDLSGKKKLTLFKFVNAYNRFVVIPVSLFLLVANIWGISQIEFISIENSAVRGLISLGGLIVLLVSVFKIIPLSKEGLQEIQRKSITASKYHKIFLQLRASFIFIMITVMLTYWVAFMLIK